MAGKQLSYDYSNVKRDLSDAFEMVIKNDPILVNLIGTGWVATSTKHEWLEDVVSPTSWTMDQDHTAADGEIDISSTSWLKEGDIVRFEKATWAPSTLIGKVGAITTNDKFAVTAYGGSSDENLLSGTMVYLMARPKNEATDADPDNGYEPSVEYNYTQIFDRTAKISKTSLEVKKYGINTAMDYQIMRQLQNLAYDMVNTTVNMPRVERDATTAWTMWGWLWFLKQGSWNVIDGSSWALTMTMINNAIELWMWNGADNLSTIVCHPIQARKISAFNTSGNNPIITRSETTAGAYVTSFVSDLGNLSNIVVSRNFDKNLISIIDPTKISLVPLQNRQFSSEDATPNGSDYWSQRILWEYTLQIKNASNSHVYIKDLAM